MMHNGPAVEQVFVLAGPSAHRTRANQPEAQAYAWALLMVPIRLTKRILLAKSFEHWYDASASRRFHV
jgi:hypothetical protein